MRFDSMIVLALAVAASGGCGDDGVAADAGRDASAPTADGGGFDGGLDAGGADAGARDSGRPMDGGPEGFLADDACAPAAGQRVVDVTGDGATVVYLACLPGGGAEIRRIDLADPAAEPATLVSSADRGWTLELSPDDAHLLFGADGSFWARPLDGVGEAVPLSDGSALAWRFLPAAGSGGGRLVVVEDDAASVRRLHVRNAADGFASASAALEDPGLTAHLTLASPSGGTLVGVVDDAGTRRYVAADLTGVASPFTLGFGPDEAALPPAGVAEGRALVLRGDALEQVDWTAGEVTAALVPSGVTADATTVAVAEPWVHLLVDGAPARRRRDGTGALETLATPTTPATHQLLSPDRGTIVFHAGSTLFGVPADGSREAVEIASIGTPSTLTAVFSPDGARIAAITAAGGVLVAPVDTAGMSLTLEAARVVAGSVGWSGDGGSLWFIVAEATGRTLHATGEAESVLLVARDVDAFWPIPGTDTAVVLRDGMLQVLGPR